MGRLPLLANPGQKNAQKNQWRIYRHSFLQWPLRITFNKKSRVYNFDANYLDLNIGDNVIVETEKGLQYGTVVSEPKEIKENEFNYPLKPVIRNATRKDDQTNSKNNQDAGKALNKAREIATELNLDIPQHLSHFSIFFQGICYEKHNMGQQQN